MNENEEDQMNFVSNWLEAKKKENNFNQTIIAALEECIKKEQNYEFDEAKFLQSLKNTKTGD